MSSKHSFTLTLSNNITEKEGIIFLLDNHTGFFKINLETKKELLDLLKIEKRYLQSFDLIYIPDMVGKTIRIHKGNDFVAIIIQPEMIGHYLGEFALTRKRVEHQRWR